MGKRVLIFGMVLIFLCGLVILVYPYLHSYAVKQDMKGQVQSFLEQIGPERVEETVCPTEPVREPAPPTEPPRKYSELWTAMTAYNQSLWQEKQAGLCDPWAYQQPSFDLEDYGLADQVFGVISIPTVDVEMPLYLGATSSHMAKGAAHLSQTSLPIGGESTNCVIAGHRGFNGAPYFRYITQLQPGDRVYITNPWETMTYVVTSTKIIAPNEVEQIMIQEGRDMITLLTCHPYASGGKQRFLIFCDRVTEKGDVYGTN